MTKQILKYVVRVEKESGMFVPIKLEETFRKSCFFGIYGSVNIKSHQRGRDATKKKAIYIQKL